SAMSGAAGCATTTGASGSTAAGAGTATAATMTGAGGSTTAGAGTATAATMTGAGGSTAAGTSDGATGYSGGRPGNGRLARTPLSGAHGDTAAGSRVRRISSSAWLTVAMVCGRESGDLASICAISADSPGGTSGASWCGSGGGSPRCAATRSPMQVNTNG